MPRKTDMGRIAEAIRPKLGWLAVFTVSLVPLVLWALLKPLDTRFLGLTATLASFGQITGLLGMSLFSIALILSARIRLLDDYFGGLNRAYLAHHIVGGTAFILLLFHPLLLSVRYVPVSLKAAALFLLPGSDLTNDFGIIALLLVMLCLVITFFVRFPYPKWRFSHKFLGSAFFFASLHSVFVASDISKSLPLRAYMLSLVGVGLAAFFYRSLFARFFVKYFEYSVEKVRPLSGNVVEIEMRPKGERLAFVAGQFVFVSFIGSGVSAESHPFSISSAASEGNLRLVVKSLGDYTSQLKNIRVGALARIEGPFGQFSSVRSDRHQIWVAGGIGITPFLSMSRSFESSEFGVDLYYCVRNEAEAIFFKELQAISERSRNFRVIPFCSETDGRISADSIRKMSGDLRDRDIFICAPPTMIKELKEQLLRLKVPAKNIHSEEFLL